MPHHLKKPNKVNIDTRLAFAKQNQLLLSLVDDVEDNLFLPGKPLSPAQLSAMIEKSCKSGMVSMKNAHEIIRSLK